MNRIDTLNHRYEASASLARTGIELVTIGDPIGARFNVAVRRLLALYKVDGSGFLDDLVGAAKALRWCQLTQAQPLKFNPDISRLATAVTQRAIKLRGAIGDQTLLDEIAAAAQEVASTNSVVGTLLLQSVEEVGATSAVVIAATRPAASGLHSWLQEHGVLVMTTAELDRSGLKRDQAYAVGPPRLHGASLVTAPVTDSVSFLFPAWFGDRRVPQSTIAAYAEGAIRIEARVFAEGDLSEPEVDLPGDSDNETELRPQPVWGDRLDRDREPLSGEVEARKLLLSGNLAMWLDDGERIRTLDPEQPVGERVSYSEVTSVRVGTYLLVRQGETERRALYQAALARMSQGEIVGRTQAAWKHQLAERIQEIGHRLVARQLRDAGVKAADQVQAWTGPHLIRPASDQDFEQIGRAHV